jgi:hypothetical protein
MRKSLTRKAKEEYNIIKETGEEITDPEEAKKYIAEYYEELYQAREGKPEVRQWTEYIKEKVSKTEQEMKEYDRIPDITLEEMMKTKRKLKNNKALGPDEIPNEIFTKATKETLKIHTEILNKTAHNHKVPESWKTGEILSIYKGKGKKGKCTNERGITLSSNFGKIYERINNERVAKK